MNSFRAQFGLCISNVRVFKSIAMTYTLARHRIACGRSRCIYALTRATAQRGPSEAITGLRIPPSASSRTSTSVRRCGDPSDGRFRSLTERNEGGQRQDDGYEDRELKVRPHRLPSGKCAVHLCEDRLFGYSSAELEQVRGRPGRRENVGQRERRSEINKRGGSYGRVEVDDEGDPECDCEGRCS